MKRLGVVWLVACLVGGGAVTSPLVVPARAADRAPAAGAAETPVARPDARAPRDRDARGPAVRERGDDASAMPRAVEPDRTTIFGISPTGAVIAAVALLLVVVLAIVAMTRSHHTYDGR